MKPSVKYIGITMLIATLAGYAVASLERASALSEEEDRVTTMRNAEPTLEIPTVQEIKRRVEWEIGRNNAAHDEWRKAIDTGTPADVASADKHGERIAEEIKEQKKTWDMEDEKNRDRLAAEKKQRHTDALAAIEKNYYTHFALTWLVTTSALLALSGYATRHWGWLRDQYRPTPIP